MNDKGRRAKRLRMLGKKPVHEKFWKKLTIKKLRKFIATKVDINSQNERGETLLHFAVCYHKKNSGVARELIKAGADIHAKTNKGNTALHLAATKNGNGSVIRELIKAGADVNAKDGNGWTPLHLAAANNGSTNVIRELIKAGADIHAKIDSDETPLHLAAKNGKEHIIRELIKARADTHEKNANGETAHDLLSKNNTLKDNKEVSLRDKASSDDNDEYVKPPRDGLGEKEYAKKVIKYWIKKPKPQIARLWGYAGTGKTTFIQSLRFGKIKPSYCAFTGKAASVMKSKGMRNATTIHGLIYDFDRKATNDEHSDKGLKFKLRRRKNLLDLVIVDECSMVNEEIGQDLLRVTKKLLVLGDQGQLPPVKGTGFFNRNDLDAIDLEFIEIHRQAENSPILDFATHARLGKKIEPSNDPACTVKIEPTPNNINSLHEEGDIIICWRNKTRHQFNKEALKRRKLKERRLMEGMQVVCLKNNRDLGLLNGTIWTVKEVGKEKSHTDGKEQKNYLTKECVLMDDEGNETKAHLINSSFGKDKFDMSHLKNKNHAAFDYGYAITCHKAQGSQWERVSIYVEMWRGHEDYDKWLYTAATRAQKSLYVLFTNT